MKAYRFIARNGEMVPVPTADLNDVMRAFAISTIEFGASETISEAAVHSAWQEIYCGYLIDQIKAKAEM